MTGILTIPSESYHADDVAADAPTLSASIAHTLCSQTPLHAWQAHPKLNPAFARDEEQKFDLGNAVHAFLLEGRDAVQVVDADTWRTTSSKEEAKEARAAGKIPMLTAQWANVQAMCAAVLEQLAGHHASPPLLADGVAEQTLVWEEDGVVCRARPDWLRDDRRTLDDLKTTGKSADPERYRRAFCAVGGDVQAAFYIRGVQRLTGETPEFRWIVVETAPPFALSVVAPLKDALELGHRKVLHALKVWRECLSSGEWPGYSADVCYVAAPEWEISRWLEREAIEEAA